MNIQKIADTRSAEFTPAPSQTIDVYLIQFNQLDGLPPTFSFVFNPTILTLPNAGGPAVTSYQVTFNLISNIPNSTVTSEENQPGSVPPSGISTTGEGTNRLTLAFTNEGIAPGASLPLHYKLTVNANGQTYTSDDPEIDIPPPS